MQQQDPEYDPIALRDFVSKAIVTAVQSYFREVAPETPPAFVAHVATCEQDSYELGEYIVEQNPYATCADLDLPDIPPGASVETRRVRKTGVLRDRTSFFPLPPTDQIPAGQVFDFIYPKLASLQDNELDTTGSQTQGSTGGDSPNHMDIYRHNVIKMIRFRYNLRNRVEGGHHRPAYMLVLYSGGDA